MLRGIKEWYAKIKRQLSSRLLLLVCVTFLPLNIVMLVLSTTIFVNSSYELANAWQREIQAAMDDVERDFAAIEKDVDAFVTEYLSELMLEGSDSLMTITMANSLGDVFEDSDLPGFLFLREKATGKMYTKYDIHSVTIQQMEQAKQAILNDLPHGTDSKWSLQFVQDRYYFMRHYEYSNYCLGIYIDVGSAFAPVHNTQTQQQDAVFITDGTTVLQRKDHGLAVSSYTSFPQIVDDGVMMHWIQADAGSVGLSVGVGIDYVHFVSLVPPFSWILVAAALMSFLLIFLIWHSLQNQVVSPLRTLQKGLEELEHHNMGFRLEIPEKMETDELKYLYEAFNHMVEEVSSSHEKDIKMYQAELDNLRLQVNPHMLLNSYNLIYSLAQTKNFECIQEYTLHLSDYFRYVLRENNTFVTLSREMQFISSYIAIQQIRFPNAFRYTCDVDEDVQQALIPPLLVENFVENAMKYALIAGKVIDVSMKAWTSEDRLKVAIEDNGQGIRPEILERITRGKVYVDKLGQQHIGIYNCRRRMELFYQGQANMSIESQQGKGTRILLDLPYLTVPVEKEKGEHSNEAADR